MDIVNLLQGTLEQKLETLEAIRGENPEENPELEDAIDIILNQIIIRDDHLAATSNAVGRLNFGQDPPPAPVRQPQGPVDRATRSLHVRLRPGEDFDDDTWLELRRRGRQVNRRLDNSLEGLGQVFEGRLRPGNSSEDFDAWLERMDQERIEEEPDSCPTCVIN